MRSAKSTTSWRRIQFTTGLSGVGLLLALFLWPETGNRILWNLIVPLLPALCVLFPGWWRNACPLATVTLVGKTTQQWLLPTGSPATTVRVRLGRRGQGIAALGSVTLLCLLLPARHLLFDRSGVASGLLLVALAVAAAVLGAVFLKKSGWCAGWCPMQSVERLYGQAPAAATVNARCGTCSDCVAVCPDSANESRPLRVTPTRWHRAADLWMAGGFVGFVWGWFQVPTVSGAVGWGEIGLAYGMPLLGACVGLALFTTLRGILPAGTRPRLVRIFAASAVGCYYWFRIPTLFGLVDVPDAAVLWDLGGALPEQSVWVARALSTAGSAAWFARDRGVDRWMVRPPSRIPLRRRLESALSRPRRSPRSADTGSGPSPAPRGARASA